MKKDQSVVGHSGTGYYKMEIRTNGTILAGGRRSNPFRKMPASRSTPATRGLRIPRGHMEEVSERHRAVRFFLARGSGFPSGKGSAQDPGVLASRSQG